MFAKKLIRGGRSSTLDASVRIAEHNSPGVGVGDDVLVNHSGRAVPALATPKRSMGVRCDFLVTSRRVWPWGPAGMSLGYTDVSLLDSMITWLSKYEGISCKIGCLARRLLRQGYVETDVDMAPRGKGLRVSPLSTNLGRIPGGAKTCVCL